MDMNPEIARKLLEVGEEFRIEGPFFSYEEIKMGNGEFTSAKKSIEKAIDDMNLQEAKVFMQEFIPSFSLTLDEQSSVI